MFLPSEPGSPNDFDFFIGDWDISHRRLKSRLTGCTEWEDFVGRSSCKKILGGFGNIDDNLLYLPGGTYRAATIRSYDPNQKTWSIWWLDARNPGSIDVPVVGRFEGGVGTFLANEVIDAKPVVVRFTWTKSELDQPRWEQAFSPDGGQTWETNWIMDFTRRTSTEA